MTENQMNNNTICKISAAKFFIKIGIKKDIKNS